MKAKSKSKKAAEQPQQKYIEGRDYYFDQGLMVLTAHFLRERGYCCANGCRHCPYPKNNATSEQKIS